jgi:PAS domain S-box-containing protein
MSRGNEVELKHTRNEAILIGQTQILKDLVEDKDLSLILKKIIRMIEGLSPNMKASIHLLDKSGKHLANGIAPSLPDGYMRLIDGEPIGPIAGSCGTAAYTGKVVIVDDISKDYRWVNYAKVALPFNLRACWSMPILSKHDIVLGTFAMYYDHIRKPTAEELEILNFVVALAGLAIQKKKFQESLKKSEELFKNSFKHAPTGIALLEFNNKFTYVNKAFCDLTGYTETELRQTALNDIIHPESLKGNKILFDNLLNKNQNSFQKEERFIHKTGIIVWATLNVAVAQDTDPNNAYLIANVEDITSKKNYQEKIITQNEELKKINKELDSFVYKASHDLRAPLTSILGLVNLADRTSPTESELSEYFTHIRKSVTKLDEFVKELIDHSRNIRMAIVPEIIDFSVLIEDIFQNLSYMESAAKVKRNISIQSAVAFKSDKTRLKIILSNLIDNAFRYNSALNDPYLNITIETDEKKAVILVEDNGIGIEAHHLTKIFDMFYRATENKTGSGLGLYIVKETVEKLKGKIEVSSAVGKGTVFKAVIPNLKSY